ncbi:MAG TPA: ABC transporter ATP-binding protein [Opitutaceae bacterium]|nr:ABC transporter ATP-binding protein [Opitutaceae bacterium]
MVESVQPVVSLREVTKRYVIWDNPSARLLLPLKRYWRRANGKPASAFEGARLFTAVNHVSLDVMPGECLGIIGRNGAGKSTLLQMIAGTMRPTAGKVAVRGRVAALLELGSGFNPDFTGRENVHLNAAILGLRRDEIAAKYDAIVAYSGIEEFIERPVRTYSSGMVVRLAFAVCVHVDADILIIDEALAVGDARFQFKCHATLEQMMKDGRTIIFVSHDTNALKRMCNTAMLLERGEVLVKGVPNDVVNLYTKLITSPHGVEAIRSDIAALQAEQVGRSAGANRPAERGSSAGTAAQAAAVIDPSISRAGGAGSELLADERAHRQISDKEYAYGGVTGRMISVVMTNERGEPRLSFLTGSRARVAVVCEAAADIPDPIYALTLKDVRGQEIYGTNTYFQGKSPPPVRAGDRVEVVFDLHLNILPGIYFVSLGWVRLVNAEVVVIHRRYDVLRFDVMPCDKSFGIAFCPTDINVRALPGPNAERRPEARSQRPAD